MTPEERARYSDLESRLRILEQRIAQIASRPVVPPTTDIRITVDSTAHGFTAGQWVRRSSTGWILAIAIPNDPIDGGPLPIVTGIISRVFSADSFEVTLSGLVTGIDNPEDGGGEFTVGLTYSLSEVNAGELTGYPTTTRLECFHPTGTHEGLVILADRCRAQLFSGGSGIAAGKVVNNSGALADASTDQDRALLGVTINDYSTSSQGIICRSGIISFPGDVSIPVGDIMWLDPTSPGDLTGTKPVTPEDQKPIPIMRSLGNNVYWVDCPGMDVHGIGDLWDVDHSTPPAQDEVHIYDDTAKRWVPGKVSTLSLGSQDANSVLANATVSPAAPTAVVAGTDTVFGRGPSGALGFMKIVTTQITDNAIDASKLIDFTGFSILAKPTTGTGDASLLAAGTDVLLGRGPTGDLGFMKVVTTQLTDKLVTAAKLADALAYTVVGNGTSSTASPVGITAGSSGVVLNRQGTSLGFSSNPDLGDSGSGNGGITIYHSAGLKFQVQLGTGKVTIEWGSSNSLVIDPADIVGTNRQFKIREMDVCDPITHAPMKVQGIFCAIY